MLSSHERAQIKSKISMQASVCFVGKEGLTENVIKSIGQALDAREGIKISLLQNCDIDVKEFANVICESLNADIVGMVGRKVIIYRYNPKASKHLLDD